MATARRLARTPWMNRFATPDFDGLRGHYHKHLGDLFHHARERIHAFSGMSERLDWLGVSWRWAYVYTHDQAPGRAWAYLIPNPERPMIAAPMTIEFVRTLPLRRLKKYVRDGLASAKRTGDILWPTWEVMGKGNLDDVMDLLNRAHKKIGVALEPAGAAS